jgi:hypothetical protein
VLLQLAVAGLVKHEVLRIVEHQSDSVVLAEGNGAKHKCAREKKRRMSHCLVNPGRSASLPHACAKSTLIRIPRFPMLRPMTTIPSICSAILVFAALSLHAGEKTREKTAVTDDAAKARLAELDVYWAEVSRAVREGDFKAYVATCHPEGVLVSGTKKTSQPLATALARWEKDFTATREGKVRGNVEFRFSQRLGDATTAHESGIFRYTTLTDGAEPKYDYIRLEALLVKRGDVWKILMENQIGPATRAQWDALR